MTRPLAGRCSADAVRPCARGCTARDWTTTITSLPCSSLRSVARSACWSQMRWLPSSGRYWRSRSRISSRRSRAIGRSSGAVGAGRRAQDAFAAQQRAQPLHPAAPRELRDDDRDERDARRRARRRSRRDSGASPRCGARRSSCRGRGRATRPGASGSAVARATATCSGPCGDCSTCLRLALVATRAPRNRARAENWPSRSAGRCRSRQRPTAYSRSSCSMRLKIRDDARRRTRRRSASRAAPAPSTAMRLERDVEIAHEPALHQRVGKRHRDVSERAEREQQRDEESQRESHGFGLASEKSCASRGKRCVLVLDVGGRSLCKDHDAPREVPRRPGRVRDAATCGTENFASAASGGARRASDAARNGCGPRMRCPKMASRAGRHAHNPAMTLDPDACYRALAAHDPRFDGRFFVGVSSTGIYCRPVCTVRMPRRENCLFFPSAAAAEVAGYRPCLRCRPELAPGHASVDASERLAPRRGQPDRERRAGRRRHRGARRARRRHEPAPAAHLRNGVRRVAGRVRADAAPAAREAAPHRHRAAR